MARSGIMHWMHWGRMRAEFDKCPIGRKVHEGAEESGNGFASRPAPLLQGGRDSLIGSQSQEDANHDKE